MKLFIIALAIMSLSPIAQASGKLSLQGNVYDQGEFVRPAAGFSIYQKMMKNIAFNSYAGIGTEPFTYRKDVMWTTAKAEVQFYNGAWTLSPGVAIKDTDMSTPRSYMFIKIERQLW